MKLFKQLKWYFIKEWKRYLGAISILIIISILQLFPPKLVGIIVDSIIQHKNNETETFWWISTMMITAITVYILRYIWRILLFGASYQLAVELRVKFYSYLSKQSPTFYLAHRTGDLMARAINDVDRVVFAAGEGVLTLVDSLVMGFSVLVVMITQISWQLTFISLLPMPIMAFLIKKYGKELHQHFRQAQAAFSSLNDQTQESLTSIRMIRAFGLEKHQYKKFYEIAKNAGSKNMLVAKIDAKFDPTIHLAISLSNLLAITFGGWLVWNQKISLGQLTSFIMYLGVMIWPMLALAWMFNIVERGSAAWDRIQSILNNKIPIKSGQVDLPIDHGNLNIKIDKFIFPNNKKYSLNKVHFNIFANQNIGICGPTGSGKSTIIRLIQKNFDIQKGNIFFHDIPLSEIKTEQWRKRLSVVNQTTFLFSDSISNNISFGKPYASQKEIEEVTKLACVHNDIIQFPEGYNTFIGERGVMLSGGQKQRIAIARALLLKSEFLILDDALSAVDTFTEKKILKSLKLWSSNGHTILIVSHQLSVLSQMDQIIVINHGTISQQGTHAELIKKDDWYKKTYYYQDIYNQQNKNLINN